MQTALGCDLSTLTAEAGEFVRDIKRHAFHVPQEIGWVRKEHLVNIMHQRIKLSFRLEWPRVRKSIINLESKRDGLK